MNSHDSGRDNRRAGDQWNSCSLKQNRIITASPILSFQFKHLPALVGKVKPGKEKRECSEEKVDSFNLDASLQVQVGEVAPRRAALLERLPHTITQAAASNPQPLRGDAGSTRGERRLNMTPNPEHDPQL